MSASDLEAILEDALRDRGHPTPGLEAQKLLFHLSRVAGGWHGTIPLGYHTRIERERMAKSMQGLPAAAIAERLECSESTVYRALRKHCQPLSALDSETLETVSPKEPSEEG